MPFVLDNSVVSGWYLENQVSDYSEAVARALRTDRAHVPVIWATQVLENLHKSGVASRAEITDAGRAAMAECIMINKGDHTLQVLKTLQDIAKRSRALKVKNRLTFRPLKIAERFFERL